MSFRGPAPLPAQRCRGSPELAGSLQVLTGVDAHRCRDRMGISWHFWFLGQLLPRNRGCDLNVNPQCLWSISHHAGLCRSSVELDIC